LIISKDFESVNDSLRQSPKLTLAGISCDACSEFAQAYFLLFKRNAKDYAIVIINSMESSEQTAQLRDVIAEQLPHVIVNEVTGSLSVESLADYILQAGKSARNAATCHQSHTQSPALSDEKCNGDLHTRYQLMIEGAGEGIIGLDCKGYITFANPKAGELLGLQSARLIGRNFMDFSLDSPLEQGGTAHSFADKKEARIGRGMVTRADGSFTYVEYTQSFVGREGEETVSIMVLEDISRRLRFERELRKLAQTDSVTKLYNRHYFEHTLARELQSQRSDNWSIMVALVDLDGFKAVNDQYGHGTGDRLLYEVSKRLNECLRRGDLLARLGGDEFAILLRPCDSSQLNQVAEKIVKRLNTPFEIGDNKIQISCSMGVTDATQDSRVSTVLERADRAMYIVKRQQKNGYYLIETEAIKPTSEEGGISC
jgi:diguanylate cyclase (GGDEF)-like protein/PAS domain S-box-containing protein